MAVDMSRVDDARALADFLDEQGFKAADVLRMDAYDWACVTAAVELEDDPDDATKSLVWHRLTLRAELEGTDPLIGLPQA